MPEGDVVWRTAGRLHQALAGQVLVGSDLRWPSLVTVDLAGWTVREVVSAGKHILCRLARAPQDRPPTTRLTLHSHLRMDGSWQVHRTGGPRDTRPLGHAVRAVLRTDTWTAVGHRLGMLDLVPTAAESTLVGHLGPDVLGPGWDPDEAVRRLAADGRRPVGLALLDQRVLAGVGTFYAGEALFVRGLTPWTAVRDAGDLRRLVTVLHAMLVANRDRTTQSTTGDLRRGAEAYVHARVGLPCRRCGDAVRVAGLGSAPLDRVMFFCPGCQRGPTPSDNGAPQAPLGARRVMRSPASRTRW